MGIKFTSSKQKLSHNNVYGLISQFMIIQHENKNVLNTEINVNHSDALDTVVRLENQVT